MSIEPLPNQQAFWHGLKDLPQQQDLFDCDLGPAREPEKPHVEAWPSDKEALKDWENHLAGLHDN
jgi:hypothetical protein